MEATVRGRILNCSKKGTFSIRNACCLLNFIGPFLFGFFFFCSKSNKNMSEN